MTPAVTIEIVGPRWEDPRELARELREEKAMIARMNRRAMLKKVFAIVKPPPRKKRAKAYRCSNCGEIGHNAQRCAERKRGA